MLYILLGASLVFFLCAAVLCYLVVTQDKKTESEGTDADLYNELVNQAEQLRNMKYEVIQTKKEIANIPGKVLESITSSTNVNKGRLGEMIGYIQLNAQYDKLICFGDITDFIGIKFPTDTDPGSVDFIDIKNGANAKLSKDQQRLKKLIEDKHIKFIKVKVDTNASQDRPEQD